MDRAPLPPDVVEHYRGSSRVGDNVIMLVAMIVWFLIIAFGALVDWRVAELMAGCYCNGLGILMFVRPVIVDRLLYLTQGSISGRPDSPGYEDRVRKLEELRTLWRWMIPVALGVIGTVALIGGLNQLL